MYFLESIFKSNNFDLNDAVLCEYSIFFNENDKEYNRFSLEDEDIPNLHKFISVLKANDNNCRIFVCTYGYELTHSDGGKFTYADQLWIDTDLSICEIKELISKAGLEEPSAVRYFRDCNEIEYCKIYFISLSENRKPVISEAKKENADQLITLYWD